MLDNAVSRRQRKIVRFAKCYLSPNPQHILDLVFGLIDAALFCYYQNKQVVRIRLDSQCRAVRHVDGVALITAQHLRLLNKFTDDGKLASAYLKFFADRGFIGVKRFLYSRAYHADVLFVADLGLVEPAAVLQYLGLCSFDLGKGSRQRDVGRLLAVRRDDSPVTEESA